MIYTSFSIALTKCEFDPGLYGRLLNYCYSIRKLVLDCVSSLKRTLLDGPIHSAARTG